MAEQSIEYDGLPPGWPVAENEMHFRLDEPTLGRLELWCDGGYVVSEYDLGYPDPREVNYPNSLDNGTFDLTRFHAERAINLQIVLRQFKVKTGQGPILAPDPALRDRLAGFLHPGRRPILTFTEHLNPRVKQCELRGTELSITISKPFYNKMSVGWKVSKGVIESRRIHVAVAQMGTGEELDEIPLENAGNANAHWWVKLVGEITDPTFIMHLPDGSTRQLRLSYDAVIGDVIAIDSFTRSVTINGKAVGYKYLDDKTDWFQIPPGVSYLTLEHSAPDRLGYPYARWQGWTEPTNWAIPPGTDPPNNPPPDGAPPWAWTADAPDPDPGTDPAPTVAEMRWRDTWI